MEIPFYLGPQKLTQSQLFFVFQISEHHSDPPTKATTSKKPTCATRPVLLSRWGLCICLEKLNWWGNPFLQNSSGLCLGPDIQVLTAPLPCSVSISTCYLKLKNSLMASGCSSSSSTSKTTDLAHIILTPKSIDAPSPHSSFVALMPELRPVTW